MNNGGMKDENDEEGDERGNKWTPGEERQNERREKGGGRGQGGQRQSSSTLANSEINKNPDTNASLTHGSLEEFASSEFVSSSANGRSRSCVGCATTVSANPFSLAGEGDNNPSNAEEGENNPEFRTGPGTGTGTSTVAGAGTRTRLSAQRLIQHGQQQMLTQHHHCCQPQVDHGQHCLHRQQQPAQEEQGHQTQDRGKLEFLFRRFNLRLRHGRRGRGDALEGQSDASRPSCMKVRLLRGCQRRGRRGRGDDRSAHKIRLVQNEDHGGRSRRCAPSNVRTVVVRGKSAVVLKDNVHRVEHDAKPLLLSRHHERHQSPPRYPHQPRLRHCRVNKRRHRQARRRNISNNLVRVILCKSTDRVHRDRNRDGSDNSNHHKQFPPCFDLLLCDPILQLSTLAEPALRSTIAMLSTTESPMRMPPISGVVSVTTVSTRQALGTNKHGKADHGVNNHGDHGVSSVATATSGCDPPFRSPLPPSPPSSSPVAAAALVCVSDETTCCPGSVSVINAMGSARAARSLCPLSWTTLPRTDNAGPESPDIPCNACAPVRRLFQAASMSSSPSTPLNVWDWDVFVLQTRTLGHVPRSSPRRSRTPRGPLLRSVCLSHSLPSSRPLRLATRGHLSDQIMDQTLNLQDQVCSLDHPLIHRQRMSFPRRAESVPPYLEGAIEPASLGTVGLLTDQEDRHPENNGRTQAPLHMAPSIPTVSTPKPYGRLSNRKRRVRSWDSQGDSRGPEQPLQPLQQPQPHLYTTHSCTHSQSVQPWFVLAEQLWGSLVDAAHQNQEQVVVESLHKEIVSVRTASPAAAAAAAWCPLLQNGPSATVHKKKHHGGTKPMWAKSNLVSVRSALPEDACAWIGSDDGGHTITGGSRRLQNMEVMELPPYLQNADTTPRTTSEAVFRTGASTTTSTTIATVTLTPVTATATARSPASPLAHRHRLGQTYQDPSLSSYISSIPSITTTSRAPASPPLSSLSSSTSSSSPSSTSSSSSPLSSSLPSSYREKQPRVRTTIHARTLQSIPATGAAFDGDNGSGGQVDGDGGGGGGGRDTGVSLVQGANNGVAVNVFTGTSPSSADSNTNTPSEVYNRGDQVYESGQSVRAHRQQPDLHHNNSSISSSNHSLAVSPQSGFTRDGEWVTGQDHERHRALGMIVGCEDGFHFHPLDTHCPHDRRVPTLAGQDDSETELDCISPGVTVRVSPPGSAATASMTMMSRTLPFTPPPLWSVSGEQRRTTVPLVLPAGSTMMSRAFPTLPATPLANEPIAHQIRRIQMPLIEQLQRQYEEQIERQRSVLEQSHLEEEVQEVISTPPLPASVHPMLALSVPMSRQPALGFGGEWRHAQRQVPSLQSPLPVLPQRSTLYAFESTTSLRSSSFSSAVVPESHRLQGSNTLYQDYEGGALRPHERWRRGDNEMLGR